MLRALATLHMPSREAELLAPFDGLVTPTMLESVRRIIPVRNAYTYKPEQFAGRSFPFEAYTLAEVSDEREDANA